MSEIDKRVVQMVFDNEDFEKNIAKSQKSLENIDRNITKMSQNSSPDVMGEAIAKAQLKFEALRTVVQSVTSVITNEFIGAISKAKSAVDNLTFDQINVGFGKYEEKLQSVQTIMSATHKSIEEVEQELERLNWFTDETSYNYSDMASNIGKFTSVGIELDKATTAMMGVANWAAISGANVQQASRAMYNLSQAMGTGVMMTQDWMSIENANMATKEFKETVILTAKEMYKEGKLASDVVDELGITVENFRGKLSEKWLTSDILMESMNVYGAYSEEVKRIQEATDSFDKDILQQYNYFVQASDVIEYLDDLKKDHKKELEDIVAMYGETSDELKKKSEELGISVEHAINIAKHGQVKKQLDEVVKEFGEGSNEFKKKAEELGLTIKEATDIIHNDAAQDIYDLGERAFKAAQEYKTFGDVISATTDAVSTLWMNIFQKIFGNFEEAKALWTELGGMFYDTFAQPVANLLSAIDTWTEYSGRINLLGVGLTETGEEIESVFTNVAAAIESVVTPIKEAFFSVFPALQDTERVGQFLAYLTFQLKEWTSQLALSSKRTRQIRRVFRSLFQIFEAGAIIVSSLVEGFKEILTAILPTGDELFGFLDKLGIKTESLKDMAYNLAYGIKVACRIIAAIISSFKQSVMDGTIMEWLKNVGKMLFYIGYTLIDLVVSNIRAALLQIKHDASNSFDGIFGVIANGFEFVKNGIKNVLTFFQNVFKSFASTSVGSSFMGFIQTIPAAITTFATTIGNALSTLFNFLRELTEGLTNLFNTINQADTKGAGLLSGIVTVLVLFVTSLIEAYKEGKKNALLESISGFFDGLSECLSSFQNTIRAQSLKAIGAALLEVAVAALVLAQIDPVTLAVSMTVLGGTLAALVGAIAIIAKISGAEVGVKGISAIMKALSNVASYIITIVLVIKAMAKMKKEELTKGLTAVAGIFVEIAAMIAIIRAVTLKMVSEDMDSYLNQIDAVLAIMKAIPIMTLALYPVASALQKLGKLDRDSLADAVIAMAGLTLMLLLILTKMEEMAMGLSANKYLSYQFYNNIGKVAGSILLIAAAASVLVGAMVVLSVVPGIQLLKGFTALSFVIKYLNRFMTQFASIFKSLSESSAKLDIRGVIALSATLPILAAAVIGLIAPMIAFAVLPFAKMLQGVLALGIVGTIMFLLMKGIEHLVRTKMDNSTPYLNRTMATNMLALASSLLLMSIAVSALMVPIYIAANYMEPERMLQAIGGFLLIMTIVIGFIASLNGVMNFSAAKTKGDSIWSLDSSANNWGGQLIKIAAGLILMAIGISILMAPIMAIGKMDPIEFGQGMLGVIGVLSAVIIFLTALNIIMNFESIGSSKSGKTLFSVDKPTKEFGKNLFKIAGALLVFAAGMYVLAKSIEILGSMDEETFINGAKKMLEFVAAIGLVALVFAVIGKITANIRKVAESSKESSKSLLTHVTSLVKTIEHIAIAIAALPIVLALIAGFDDDVFRTGILRVAELLGLIAVFFFLLEGTYALLFKDQKIHNKQKGGGTYSEENSELTHNIENMGDNMKAMASAMLTVVGAIAFMIIPIAILGKMDTEVITQGVAVIAGLMMAMTILFAGMGYLFAEHTAAQIWAMLPVIVAVGGLITAMMVLTVIIGSFAVRDPGAFASGLLAVIVPVLALVASMAILVKATQNRNNLKDIWKTLLAYAAAIAAIGIVMYMLTKAYGEDNGARHAALDAAITLGVMIALMVGSLALLSSNAVDDGKLIKASLAFIAFAAAVGIVAGSLYLLTTQTTPEALWESVRAILTIIGVVAALLGILAAANEIFPEFAIAVVVAAAAFALVAIAVLAFAAGIYILVHALKYLGENWTIIEEGLNNITEWLKTHAEDWEEIVFTFLGHILKRALDVLGNIGHYIWDIINGINTASGYWDELQAKKEKHLDYNNDKAAFEAQLKAAEQSGVNQGAVLKTAIENFMEYGHGDYKRLNSSELKEFTTMYMTGLSDESNKEYRDEMARAYLAAGGEIYIESLNKWINKDLLTEMSGVYFDMEREQFMVDQSKIDYFAWQHADDQWASYGFNSFGGYIQALRGGFDPQKYGEYVIHGFAEGSSDEQWAQLGFNNAAAYEWALKNGLKIHSPSKDTAEIGDNTYKGFESTLDDKRFGELGVNDAQAYVDGMNSTMQDANKVVVGGSEPSAEPDAYGVLGGQASKSFIDEFFKGLVNGWDNNYFFSLGQGGVSSLLSGLTSGFPSISSAFSGLSDSLKGTLNFGGIFGSDTANEVNGKSASLLDQAIDGIFGSNTDLATTVKNKLSSGELGSKLESTITQTAKNMANGMTFKDAIASATELNFGTSQSLKDVILGYASESLGIDFSDLTGENGILSGFNDFDMSSLVMDKVKIDPQSALDAALDFGKTDGTNVAENYAAGIDQGMLKFDASQYNYDPSKYLEGTNLDTSAFYDTGVDQAMSQLDGYDTALSDYSGKYDFSSADLSKSTNAEDISGLVDKDTNLIWRGYGRNGEELWAPSKEDMYNNLVKPIRDGFEWHGWDAKDATPWKAVETAADAMKDAAETEKTIITDAKKQRWELDENAGLWYAIDENGKRINKTDAEGKESPWSVPAQKQDAKIQNGVWVWDATNKQWILTVNGKYADLGNGIQLADTKSGILDTPSLTDAQYQALTAKLANDEKKKTADQRKNDLLYGDLDKKIQAFTDKSGKQLYYGGKKVEATDYYTGEKKTIQKKYALRGKKLAGYDNAYALVDEKGNLIFNDKGERITFTVDKTNGVKLMSESMTQAANTMNEAGKEVQNAAKNPNTQAAMYGASTAVGNAEATKDVYSTAVVHNQDTGLVESKYNNDVVPQNAQQQAQDATQSAKSAIDHLQEINSKMTEVRDLMISNNMMLATIEALNMNMDKSMKDASARPFEVNIDGKKVAEATKGFMNKSLGVVSRMGGRQVAT